METLTHFKINVIKELLINKEVKREMSSAGGIALWFIGLIAIVLGEFFIIPEIFYTLGIIGQAIIGLMAALLWTAITWNL